MVIWPMAVSKLRLVMIETEIYLMWSLFACRKMKLDVGTSIITCKLTFVGK